MHAVPSASRELDAQSGVVNVAALLMVTAELQRKRERLRGLRCHSVSHHTEMRRTSESTSDSREIPSEPPPPYSIAIAQSNETPIFTTKEAMVIVQSLSESALISREEWMHYVALAANPNDTKPGQAFLALLEVFGGTEKTELAALLRSSFPISD